MTLFDLKPAFHSGIYGAVVVLGFVAAAIVIIAVPTTIIGLLRWIFGWRDDDD